MEHTMHVPRVRLAPRLISLLLVLASLFALTPTHEAHAASYSVVTAKESLTMRKTANSSATSVGKLLPGDVVSVTSRSGNYSYVKAYATGTKGYVLTSYLKASTDDEPLKGTRYVNAEKSLTMRKTASTSATMVTTLVRGEAVTLLGRKAKFARVRDAKNNVGYVLESYLVTKKPADSFVDTEKVTLPSTLTIKVGEVKEMPVTISPSNATDQKSLMWSRSNGNVNLVGNRSFEGVSVGTCTVYAELGTLKSNKCVITVVKDTGKPSTTTKPSEYVKVTKVVIPSTFTIKVGEVKEMPVTISPSNATDQRSLIWIWKTNDQSVYMDGNRSFEGSRVGKAIVYAELEGIRSNECVITVVAK